jgi:DNA-binding response OmpR family regulator
MKILIAYDSEYRFLPETLVTDSSFSIELSTSKAEASERIHLYEYDCILLCSDAESREFQTLLNEVTHSNKSSGLIFISKEITVEQKVKALNAGVDDCLLYPIHPEEIKARILAIIRRKKFNAHQHIHFANLIIDLHQKKVLVWNTPIALTPKEYEILLYLIMNQQKIVAPALLSEYLWREASEDKESNNLIVHIKNLRKKLKQSKAEIEIKNVYAIGYQIIEL